MIPKRIFYCWITADETSPELPQQYKVAIDQWKLIANPENGWEYVFVTWDYMKENYDSYVIEEMRKIGRSREPACIADYCRLVVTINKGGFYLDLDTIMSTKFLDLVNSEVPIISARPGMDMQFMCHPGINKIPRNIMQGCREYKPFKKMIVGNYVLRSSSRNLNYLTEKMKGILSGFHDWFDIFELRFWDYKKQKITSTRYFYFNQPLFHFDFNSHDGKRLGFEAEFNSWSKIFLDYFINHHD